MTKSVIINFPRFAGGKFIINCLGLSKHFCIQHSKFIEHLLKYPDDYQYRLDAVLASLPPSQQEMKQWISRWEYGEVQLFGVDALNSFKVDSKLVKALLDSPLRMPLCSHGGDVNVKALLKVWPESQIVTLINHRKFSLISQQLKSNDTVPVYQYAGNYCVEKYTQLQGPSWPTWSDFESTGYRVYQLFNVDQDIQKEIDQFYKWSDVNNPTHIFDVDNNVFDEKLFVLAIKNLYQQLELDDYNQSLVSCYWRAYMNLHTI